MIGVYYQLGVRQMLFAYNKSNGLCGGCLDGDAPLTALGRAAVTEMNRVGMVVDCSHISESASLEIATLSSQPVIYSHSNPRVLCDHPRNIADAQIRACAATGGVIGINGIGSFLGGDTCDAERIVRHIDYLVDLVGIDYVGIGLDSVLNPETPGIRTAHGRSAGRRVDRIARHGPARGTPSGNRGAATPGLFR